MSVYLSPNTGPSPKQLILASLPLFALICYFLVFATRRPLEPCYSEASSEYEVLQSCDLIPLKEVVLVHAAVCFVWLILALYLSFFIPKRHALVKKYLCEGNSMLGDVYYDEQAPRHCFGLLKRNYGLVAYPHPQFDKVPVFVRRQVRVLEHYTRERVTLLYLDDLPFSAQPSADLEFDLAIFERDEGPLQVSQKYAWGWIFFCYVALLYLLKMQHETGLAALYDWQPDYDGTKRDIVMCTLLSCIVLPLFGYLAIVLAWVRHLRWMTHQHEILEEGGEWMLTQ